MSDLGRGQDLSEHAEALAIQEIAGLGAARFEPRHWLVRYELCVLRCDHIERRAGDTAGEVIGHSAEPPS